MIISPRLREKLHDIKIEQIKKENNTMKWKKLNLESNQRGQKSQREIFASIVELVYGDAINPDEYVLHHIDGSHANNKISNLSLVKKELHTKLHIDAKRNVGLNPNEKIDGLAETRVDDYVEELINLFFSKEDGVNYISIPMDVWATIQNNIRNSKPDAEDLNPKIDVSDARETNSMSRIKRHSR